MSKHLRWFSVLFCLFALTLTVRAADDTSSGFKWPHVRLGGISISGGYSRFSGPFWGPYYGYPYSAAGWGWGAYDPWWGSYPFFAPGYGSGFAYQYGYGKVRLRSVPKTSTIFINGGFAGDAGHAKDLWLEPGVYRIELANSGKTVSRKVYVLSGKTLSLSEHDFDLSSN